MVATPQAPAAPAAPAPTIPPTLEGPALLDYAKANASTPEKDLILGAGYAKIGEDGKVSILKSRYYKAISVANGFAPAPAERKAPTPRTPGCLIRVGPKGLIPIGAAYTRQIPEMKPGVYVSVYVDNGVLVLDPTSDEAIAKTEEVEKAEGEAQAKAKDEVKAKTEGAINEAKSAKPAEPVKAAAPAPSLKPVPKG